MDTTQPKSTIASALFVSIFALFSTTLLDLPEVKPWTNSFEGVSLARRSARHKFSGEGCDYAPRWARQHVSSSPLLHPLPHMLLWKTTVGCTRDANQVPAASYRGVP